MNGWLRIATLVPPAGLIPLGFVILASFSRLAPVPVPVVLRGGGRAAGASR
jgi:hypothetical protein